MKKRNIIYLAAGLAGFSLLWMIIGEISLNNLTKEEAIMRVESITPNLVTENVNRTVDFYGEMFGFRIIQSVPETGEIDFAIIGRDGVQLMFQKKSSWVEDLNIGGDFPIGASQNLYIVIDGIGSLYERINNKAEVISGMRTTFYGMKEFTILDCNGYMLTFAEKIE